MKKNKQTVKGLLPIVGMLIISLSLSGCKKPVEADVGAETTGITQAVGEAANSESVTEIKTIEPPEDGWTWEQLSDVTYINNQKIESDITCEFLEAMFTIDVLTYYEEMSTASAFLNFNDKYAFSVAFYYNAPEKINKKSIVKNLVFSSKQNDSDISNKDLISINGIGLDSSYDDMILQLGSPTEDDGSTSMYTLNGGKLFFFTDDEDGKTINFISIILEEQK